MNLNSKNLFWSLLNLVLILALLFGVKVLISKSFYRIDPNRTITVSAEGKAVVTPDVASVSFSVVTEGLDPEVIQAENSAKMNAAIDFIKGEGIDARDIKTSYYNLSPKYEYRDIQSLIYPPPPTGAPRISGYTVTQSVMVKVRDLDKVGLILGGLPEYGINQIDSVSFDVGDPDQYLNEAREQAFAKARDKARVMAELNGVKIRRVVTFSEGFGGGPVPYYLEAAGKGGDMGAPTPPTIEPGTQEVTVTVSVTYEIR